MSRNYTPPLSIGASMAYRGSFTFALGFLPSVTTILQRQGLIKSIILLLK
jgi:hypothetical protein